MNRLAGAALLVMVVVGILAIQQHRANEAEERASTAALALANMAAERDSTRAAALTTQAATKLLGDSLRLVERRVLQAAQRGDAIDRALGRERHGRYLLSTTLDSLQSVARSVARFDSTHATWQARFDLREAPYTIGADVVFPTPPDSARITLSIALDPIHVDARVMCSDPNEHGIKTASIVASSPNWATVQFDRVEQSPDICASRVPIRERPIHRRIAFKRLVIGAGRVLQFDGRSAWGVFIGSGIELRI